MSKTILVISDLHLGGEPGFQMCSPAGRTRLAEFVRWAAEQRADVHLVLNGDVVDFLAEGDASGGYSAFSEQEEAVRKFARIREEFGELFDALRAYCRTGKQLTVLLGNHDIELSLPAVRSAFLEAVGGNTEFIYDNEALVIGPVLIEHGNRYDGWNSVRHDQLRRMRSKLSRREDAPPFDVQPGSELVARVMNPVKHDYAFVDLLKPETEGVLPILAVLNPALVRKALPALKGSVLAWYRGRRDAQGAPIDHDLVAAQVADGAVPHIAEALPASDAAAFALAEELIAQAAPMGGLVSANPIAAGMLLKALRRWRSGADRLFDVDFEAKEYLEPAGLLAGRGFEVVVFGHTHHAKRVPLAGGATYLNSGTWADLMRMPEAVYAGSEEQGTAALQAFLDRVSTNDVDGYRRQVATFCRIEVDDVGKVKDADTWFFDGPGSVARVSSEGVRARLL